MALYLSVILAVPAGLAAFPVVAVESPWAQLAWVMVAPLTWCGSYVLVAAALSLRHQAAIKPGQFRRCLSDPAYRHRRLYGLCWTAVYYCTPVYFVWLSVPLLKKCLFRLFGYRGQTDFTIYPDTWIRDLPLLDIGKGAYLSNRATIGTNVAFRSGTLLVEGVTIGAGALVGHLTMLAPGVKMGDGAEVGVGCAVGIRASIGAGAKVGAVCVIDNGAVLDDGVVVGTWVYVGSRTRITSDASIPSGRVIPPRRVITGTPAEATGTGNAA